MKIKSINNTEYYEITDVSGLDPIHVILREYEPGQGRIIIYCFGLTLSYYWGSMSKDLKSFFIDASTGYICQKFINNIKADISFETYVWDHGNDEMIETDDVQVEISKKAKEYICHIIEAVKDAFRQIMEENKQREEILKVFDNVEIKL